MNNTTFNDLEINQNIKDALIQLNLTTTTEIQTIVIPHILSGTDVIAQSQTGTGKTLAYLIPIVQKINIDFKHTQSLILCPTRELALQVYKELLKLIMFCPRIKVSVIMGGESYERQFESLAKNPHIIIGTPGRIIDQMDRKTIDFSNCSFITLDEADEMLKMGFQEDLEKILSSTSTQNRQTTLFSATYDEPIKKIAKKYLNNPIFIKTESKSLTVDLISQYYYIVKEEDKNNLLIRLLDFENPKSAIIFCNTKVMVDKLTDYLKERNYEADSLHGDLRQRERNYIMNKFKTNELVLLIATDVAARGIDVENIDIIINYDIPQQNELYIHRIGRTGRAGKTGKSFTFVTPRRTRIINILEALTKSKITKLDIPTKEEIIKKKLHNYKNNLVKMMSIDAPQHLHKFKDILINQEYKDLLLNAFINQSIPTDNEYDDIVIIENKTTAKKNTKNTKSNLFSINLGRIDNINPKILLQILDEKYQIYSKNIGDINIKRNETVFEIKNDQKSRINNQKKAKYNNKLIVIKQIFNN